MLSCQWNPSHPIAAISCFSWSCMYLCFSTPFFCLIWISLLSVIWVSVAWNYGILYSRLSHSGTIFLPHSNSKQCTVWTMSFLEHFSGGTNPLGNVMLVVWQILNGNRNGNTKLSSFLNWTFYWVIITATDLYSHKTFVLPYSAKKNCNISNTTWLKVYGHQLTQHPKTKGINMKQVGWLLL